VVGLNLIHATTDFAFRDPRFEGSPRAILGLRGGEDRRLR